MLRRRHHRLCAIVAGLLSLIVALGGVPFDGPSRAQAATTPPVLNPSANPLLIGEFRLRGTGGAGDEFVEVYNNSDTSHTVASGGGSTGYALVASEGVVRFVIPNGIVIPARGHFLGCNSGAYSLASYPAGTGTATCDATFTSDIPDNAGIALFNTAVAASFTAANRLDAVGSTTEANALFKKGNGYPALNPLSIDSTFVRALIPDGRPKNTNNNAADFLFVDTNATQLGAGQRLGAAGPENLAGPTSANGAIGVSLLDPCVGAGASPNVARNSAADPANNSQFGTVDIRRTITNNTGQPITRLRFRIVDLTTFPSPSGVSDLRPRTSPPIQVTVDRAPCGSGTSSVAVQGTTLEQPPTQFNGGGINSSFSATTVNSTTPLAPGASIDLRFLLGVQQTGTARFKVIVETLPAGFAIFETSGDTETGLTNTPPIVTLPGVSPTFAPGGPGVEIDPGATVEDITSPDFGNGSVVASVFEGGTSDDLLTIRNQGTGAGQIGLNANTVTFGGTGIGTFSGGTGPTPLVVALNTAASTTAVQALLRNLTFANTATSPDPGPRTVEIAVNDGDGGVTSAFQVVIIGAPEVADLAISLSTAPNPAAVGGALTYTATVTNNGPSAATGVTATVTWPPVVTFGSASPGQGTCAPTPGQVACTLGEIASGASVSIAVVVTGTSPAAISATATVTSPVTDPNTGNNTTNVNTAVAIGGGSADVALSLAANPSPVIVGNVLTYTATIRNNGPDTATAVQFLAALPGAATAGGTTPSQGTCAGPPGAVNCALGSLANGATASVQVRVTPTLPGTAALAASVTSGVPDGTLANNTSAQAATVIAVPPSGGSCTPRPPVKTTVVRQGAGLLATFTAGINTGTPINTLTRLRLGTATNALIDLSDGRTNLTGSIDISLPVRTTKTTLLLRQRTAGAAVTVRLVVQDECGDFATFVGGGPAAFR